MPVVLQVFMLLADTELAASGEPGQLTTSAVARLRDYDYAICEIIYFGMRAEATQVSQHSDFQSPTVTDPATATAIQDGDAHTAWGRAPRQRSRMDLRCGTNNGLLPIE